MLDDELLQLDREGQLLQQDAVGLARMAVLDTVPSGTTRLPRKVGCWPAGGARA